MSVFLFCFFFILLFFARMKVVLFSLLVCLFSVSFAAPLATVEGTWTDSRYGHNLYICVDDVNSFWATYSEAGVLWGRTNVDRTIATGEWFEAGDAHVCSHGTWQAQLFQETPDEILFTYFCSETPGVVDVQFTETRLSTISNDAQCNVVTQHSSVDGSWRNKQQGIDSMIACEDGNQVRISINNEQKEFIYAVGTSYNNGEIVTGLWFANDLEQFGPYMFFPTSAGEGVQFFWSGDFINSADFANPELHHVTHVNYVDSDTDGCKNYSYIVDTVGAASIQLPAIAFIAVTVLLVLL